MSDSLKRVRELGETLVAMDNKVAELETQLAEAKQARDRVQLEDLPMLMAEIGVASIELLDGSVVSIVEKVQASITEKKKPAALKWLTDNGFGGLIRTKVITEFAREERSDALALAERLAEGSHAVTVNEAVHHQTLLSFIRERMAAGAEIPMDLFSIHPYNKAEVKRPK